MADQGNDATQPQLQQPEVEPAATPRGQREKKVITLPLDPELVEVLDQMGWRKHMRRTGMIREAIGVWLELAEHLPPKTYVPYVVERVLASWREMEGKEDKTWSSSPGQLPPKVIGGEIVDLEEIPDEGLREHTRRQYEEMRNRNR